MSTGTPQPTNHTIDGEAIPTLDDIAAQHFALAPWVLRTPVFDRHDLGSLEGTLVNFKFELLQASGSFKARGAFTHLLSLDAAQRAAGVTCVSGGNHAIAVAYAAMRLGIGAKVVLLRTASAACVALCRHYRADVVMAPNAREAFDLVRRIEADEGRYFVHPFNGYRTVLGTATLGYEWATQAPDLEAVIVPVGGGGLAAGVATALRLANPNLHVFGVEPEGADVMSRSFAANHTVQIAHQHSIADSLVSPHTEQYSYALCRRHVDRIVTVPDDALRHAMRVLFDELKLAVEPACAAATAALLGPLRDTLQGRRIGVLLSGTNIDPAGFAEQIALAYPMPR
ncbi:pyridoxal-phosphate dependent enzyme [Paraburkholderia caballeronis]|uniref:Threonine dehydratase n=1 Tax=Paraburkholderia caballeronis TaxID=416943 RepID=A0A1H7JLZ8_9BURK|nr:pyridoxal-phosphate dependent enzyme [Paraburkholderia caballeronis]PXW27407.1 threonine dehydratase [Paraburkholderia caballeronis]PXX02881.1 threonine dehydratase [Paraburkholderia caballeronis]RAK03606.1 threonine dehydratase [Paraburkholderia caballeronis]SEC30765.1 threonine dehydratase [Paraburkholderia caballeronis]SEK74485.1 threonine dehydratase [Paraburkholderia caballeronis]